MQNLNDFLESENIQETEISEYITKLPNYKLNFENYYSSNNKTPKQKLDNVYNDLTSASNSRMSDDIFIPYFQKKSKLSIYLIEHYLINFLKNKYAKNSYISSDNKKLNYIDLNDFTSLGDEEKDILEFIITLSNQTKEKNLTYILNKKEKLNIEDISNFDILYLIIKNSILYTKEEIFEILKKLEITSNDVPIQSDDYYCLFNNNRFKRKDEIVKEKILLGILNLLKQTDKKFTFDFLKNGDGENVALLYALQYQTKKDFIKYLQILNNKELLNAYFLNISNIILHHNGKINKENLELLNYLIDTYSFDLKEKNTVFNFATVPSWLFLKDEKIKNNVFIADKSFERGDFRSYNLVKFIHIFSKEEKLLNKILDKNLTEDVYSRKEIIAEAVKFIVLNSIKLGEEHLITLFKNNKLDNSIINSPLAVGNIYLKNINIKAFNYNFISIYPWMPIKYIKSNLSKLNVYLLFQFLDDSLQPELEKIRNFQKNEKNRYFFFEKNDKFRIISKEGHTCNKSTKKEENYLCQTCIHLFSKYLDKTSCKNKTYQWQGNLDYLEKDIEV